MPIQLRPCSNDWQSSCRRPRLAPMDEKQLEAVRRAKARFSRSVPKGVDVVGVGIGVSGSDPALKVNLRAAPKDESSLPKTIDGVKVIYDYVGKITPR